MSTTFEPADGTTMKLMQQCMKKFHKPLVDAQVTIDVQLWSGEEDAPAVKVGGYDTNGKVEFIKDHHRKAGAPDARLIIDRAVWENAGGPEREAILDHLLQQIEVRTQVKSGEVIRDGAGRPKLKRRKFDLRIAGFARVAEEHGKAAIETKAYAQISHTFHQLKLFEEVAEMRATG